MTRARWGCGVKIGAAVLVLLTACQGERAAKSAVGTGAGASVPKPSSGLTQHVQPEVPLVPPATLREPVRLWESGRSLSYIDATTAHEQGLLLLDLGETWTPYLFSDGPDRKGKNLSNAYRPTYLALARGDFPNDLQGERAKADKYLELFGILPTLSVLRARMLETARRTCAEGLDLEPLQTFRGLVTYSDNKEARRAAAAFASAEQTALASVQEQAVSTVDDLDLAKLTQPVLGHVMRYKQLLPQWRALDALQKRLQCEGYLTGKGKYLPGVMDWATHSALAEYERRHSVFSLGYLGKDSLTPLRRAPLDVDREAVLRLLTERAMHMAGVLEDGSIEALSNADSHAPNQQLVAATFLGSDGEQHPVPNLAQALRERIIEAFGLQSPETTLGWLTSLGDLSVSEPRFVAIKAVALPEYYAPEMALTLDYDRGDVWYDFPYDDKGKEISQPVSRRPQVTVSTLYKGQKIPLARYGTTIGGWRTELIDGAEMWKYKDSPVGERAWDEIIAAPVWLPPDGTPHEGLLRRNYARNTPSDPEYLVNYHETGPGYASAYGLVAAYHRTFLRRADGRIALGTDEGIRTHGSVDYMSIMRRHSHGCHRLHNHVALRLMSFVLAHRAHERLGAESISYARYLQFKNQSYRMEIKQGGYVFKLATPLIINVEEGRIRGTLKAPIETPIPEFDPDKRAYVMRDGSAVKVRGNQLVPCPLPPPLPAASTRGALLARTAPGAGKSRSARAPQARRVMR